MAAAPGFYNNLLCGASSEKLFYDTFIDFSFGATIHMMSAGIITMVGITCPISATTFLLTNLIGLALNSLVDIFGVKEHLKSFVNSRISEQLDLQKQQDSTRSCLLP